jgi:thiamine biosynthesis lipoprotein
MKLHVVKNRKRPDHSLWLSLLVIVAIFSSCAPEDQAGNPLLFSGQTMGTTYTVKVRDMPENVIFTSLREGIDQILERINSRMSTYRENSELSLFNRSTSTDWSKVSPETVRVINEALRVSYLTNGAFDVTVAPLVNMWGFGPEPKTIEVPSQGIIKERLPSIGYQHLHTQTSPPAIRKDHPNLQIDLSAIAKGYAVDQVAEYLESLNISHFLVEIGGELRGKGHNSTGFPWKVAIEKPASGERTIHRVLYLQSHAMATSGDYRNFFEKNGKRFSHTINPQTGQPITHQLASVTVVRASCMEADALATGLMVLGPEEGYKLAVQEKFPVLFVSRTQKGFEETMTSELEPYLRS